MRKKLISLCTTIILWTLSTDLNSGTCFSCAKNAPPVIDGAQSRVVHVAPIKQTASDRQLTPKRGEHASRPTLDTTDTQEVAAARPVPLEAPKACYSSPVIRLNFLKEQDVPATPPTPASERSETPQVANFLLSHVRSRSQHFTFSAPVQEDEQL